MHIRVLTWNISFGAMMGSDLDVSSLPLPQVCREKGEFEIDDTGIKYTQCLNNVVQTIDTSALSEPYDFVALQEASNCNIVFSKSTELQRMGGFVHHMADFEDMITFYDEQKYNLLAVKVGNLVPGDGRPYQILFLQNTQDMSHYIFINLHNGHGTSRERLEQKLSANINRGFIPRRVQMDAGRAHDNHNHIGPDVSDTNDISQIIKTINEKDVKVIMAGDTNDSGYHDYWKNFKPFNNTQFENLKSLEVKSNRPPFTCCAPMRNYPPIPIRRAISDDTLIGDYILVSQNLSVVHDNRVLLGVEYDAQIFPTSDHLPIEIVLKPIPTPALTTNRMRQSFARKAFDNRSNPRDDDEFGGGKKRTIRKKNMGGSKKKYYYSKKHSTRKTKSRHRSKSLRKNKSLYKY